MSDPLRLGLVGSTGLVGRAVMEALVGRGDFRLFAIARREVPLPRGARMEMHLAAPQQWPGVIARLDLDLLVCALGTTWRKAGRDEAPFREVDERLVLAVARAARQAGVRHFVYVSAAGANPLARNLYFRVKGEVEKALIHLRFPRLDIVRPGLLRGRRTGDSRPFERLGILLAPVADLFLRGHRRRYRSISVDTLAAAILGLAGERAGGRFVHEYDSLVFASRRLDGKRGG